MIKVALYDNGVWMKQLLTILLIAATVFGADVRLICNANPPSEQVTHYGFWERTDGANWTLIGTTPDATDGVRFQRPFGKYTWSATAFNAAGMSEYATPLEFELRDDAVTLKRPTAPVQLAAVIDPWTLFPGASSGTTLTNGLIAFYRMDESSGDLTDSWGNYTLTNVGSMGFTTGGGIVNGAVSNSTFSASGRYFWRGGANTNKWFPSSISAFSLAAWFFSTNTAIDTDGELFGPTQYNTAIGTHAQFSFGVRSAVSPGRILQVIVSADGGAVNRKIYYTTNSLPINSWTHCAATFTNDTLKLYTNGVEVTGAQLWKSQDSTVASIANSTNNASQIGVQQLTLSGGSSSASGNGAMDAAGIWNRVLTDAEVAELYNSGNGRQLP